MLERLRIFVSTVERGGFSAAGKVLGLSPSSVSRHVDRLEADLKTKLLRRSTRAVQLTPAGSRFFDRARRLVAEFDDLYQIAAPVDAELSGVLRLSVFESFGRQYLAPLLAEFLLVHPHMRVSLELDNQLVDLYRDNIDLAIRIGRPTDSRLKARKLLDNVQRLCAAPAYLERHAVPREPDELRSHNCLTLNRHRRIVWWHFRRGRRYRKVRVSGSLSSLGGAPLLEGARRGLGIALLPEWMLGEDLARGELVELMPAWRGALREDGSGEVYAVYLNDKYKNPGLRAFLDFLAAQFPLSDATVPTRVRGRDHE